MTDHGANTLHPRARAHGREPRYHGGNGAECCRQCDRERAAAARAEKREIRQATWRESAAVTICVHAAGESEIIPWDDIAEAHEALAVLLADQPCGPRCGLIHAVVTRDGDRVRSHSYGPTPVGFWPGGRDRQDETGLKVIRATPPKPRYARDRAEEFRICYPRTVWGRLAAPRILARANVTQPTAAAAAAGATAGAAHINASGRTPRRRYAGGHAGRKMTRRELQR